ncbi:MAG TPA: GNAT family N-acetyltransferase [Anaerolineae bacterium]|nr:GNAT family N-acetyltransferase [Anaerolineae bacterium]
MKVDAAAAEEQALGGPSRSLTTRLYQSAADLWQMYGMLMGARSRTSDWRFAHVGELAWTYFMVDCHLDPCQYIRLWHDAGRLAGYAILGEDPSFDCQILPEYEWTGIEEEALAWAEECLEALRGRGVPGWGGALASGSRQDDAKRLAFLDRHGFQYCGRFAEVNMIRSLEGPIPTGPLPEGFCIRAVDGQAEAAGRAAIQRDVWQPWSVGNVSAGDYARFMRMPGYERELDLVAVAPGGTFASYVNGWIDPVNHIGDFGPVGARPAYRRLGLTRALLLEGLRRMQALGMDRACISTNNTPARSLYESVGFTVVNRYLDYLKL